MTLLEETIRWREAQRRELLCEVRERTRFALRKHLPGARVWVYGSVANGSSFNRFSDVDLALESLPAGLSIELAQSLLSREIGREVDVCLLDETPLREEILRTGERWIP